MSYGYTGLNVLSNLTFVCAELCTVLVAYLNFIVRIMKVHECVQNVDTSLSLRNKFIQQNN